MPVFELQNVANYAVGSEGADECVDRSRVGRSVFCTESLDEVVL